MPALLLALIAPAAAHPMGSSLNGHRLELQVEPGALRADLLVEIPTQRMLKDLRSFLAGQPAGTSTEAFTAALADELVTGLQLRVDGVATPWVRQDEAAPRGEADARYVSAHLRLRAELPPEARTLQIVNGNLPDEASLFLVGLHVSEGLLIDDCSLWERDEGGAVVRDRDGQWRMEEESRDLRLSLRPRGAGWTALLRAARELGGGGSGGYELALQRAADAPWLGLEPAGRRGVVAVGLALSLGIGIGLCGRLRGGGWRLAVFATGLALASALGVLAGAGATLFDGVGGGALAALAVSGLLAALRVEAGSSPVSVESAAPARRGRRLALRAAQGFLSVVLLSLALAFIWRGVQAL